MAGSNPFSQGYYTIWQALTVNGGTYSTQFNQLVKPSRNTQINEQTQGFVPPMNAQLADRPAVKIGLGRLLEKPYQRNSIWSELSIAYPLEIMSGAYNVDQLSLLNIVILQALTTADGTTPGKLGNPTLFYSWVMAPADQRVKDSMLKQPLWTCYQQINTVLMVPIADLLTTTYT